jgi:hypothetical protein
MKQTSLLVAVVLAASAGVASAGGQTGSIGVGAEYQLSGLGGASLNYDAGQFHLGGFFGFFDPQGPDNTVLEIGARFFYHLHSTAMSDFSIGGNFGLASIPAGGMANNNRDTDVYLEPAFQIRLFVASNVALSFTGGLTIGLIDAGGASVQGQGISGSPGFDPVGVGFSGGAGVHYYFF